MKNKKRYYIAVLCLGLSLVLAACGSGTKSMRLRKAEGTVKINNAKDKELKTKENLKLYSGYNVRTKSESYAWVDLDSVKLTKLDQDSRAEIIKDGKDLTIELISGSIFFNVTEPLKDNESMDIRTSTLAIGIRGTCGWVGTSEDDDIAWVYLLEGKVECTMGDESVRVRAGEMATITEDGELVVEEFDADAIPDFVQSEADEDEDVDKLIRKVSGSGGSSAPKGSGAFNQGGTEADADGQGESDILLGQGGAGSQTQDSVRNGTNAQRGTKAPAGGGVPTQAPAVTFIPWEQAGLEDHVMDWKDPALAESLAAHLASSYGIRGREIMLSDVWERTSLSTVTYETGKEIRDISALGELTNLKSLYITDSNLSDLTALGNLTNLTTLQISGKSAGTGITDVTVLGNLTNLKSLDLSFNRIRDVTALGNLTNLERLNLSSNRISDVTALGNLTNLRSLSLGSNSISDVTALGNLTNLTYLNLGGRGNNIGDASALKNLTQLKELEININGVTYRDPSILTGQYSP